MYIHVTVWITRHAVRLEYLDTEGFLAQLTFDLCCYVDSFVNKFGHLLHVRVLHVTRSDSRCTCVWSVVGGAKIFRSHPPILRPLGCRAEPVSPGTVFLLTLIETSSSICSASEPSTFCMLGKATKVYMHVEHKSTGALFLNAYNSSSVYRISIIL